MKTATLTFQKADNYGALLQAYALNIALEKAGCENEILNYSCSYMVQPYSKQALYRKGIIRYILGLAYHIVRLPRRKGFDAVRAIMPYTERLDKNQLKQIQHDYDKFIVGSDQVWNDSITNLDKTYLLDFVDDDKKKHSYAASFGFNKMPVELLEHYSELKSFTTFNVRENSAKKIIEDITGRNADVVLDPTMLLEKEEWLDFADSANTRIKDQYLLVYQITLSNKLLKIAKNIAREKKLKIVTIPFPLGGWIKSNTNISAGPKEWVRLFSEANYIVTDSFHGCCMSVVMNVNFNVVITGAGTRIVSLLDNMKIKERLVCEEILDTGEIEWDVVNEKLRKYRIQSNAQLLKIIE